MDRKIIFMFCLIIAMAACGDNNNKEENAAPAAIVKTNNSDAAPQLLPVTQDLKISPSAVGPRVAALLDGKFVVVWASDYTIKAKTYSNTNELKSFDVSSAGSVSSGKNALYTDSKVNESPAVASFSNGDFVVVWEHRQYGASLSGHDIRARLFTQDGTALTDDFLILSNGGNKNIYPTLQLSVATIGLDNNDTQRHYVVSWQDLSNYSKHSAIKGLKLTNAEINKPSFANGKDPFLISTSSQNELNRYPAVVGARDEEGKLTGDFLVAWSKKENPVGNADRNKATINYKLFRENKQNETIFQATDSARDSKPAVASLTNGDFIISWAKNEDGSDSNSGIAARRFFGPKASNSGAPKKKELLVESFPSTSQYDFSISALLNSAFVVSWSDGKNIQAKTFNSGDNVAIHKFNISNEEDSIKTDPWVVTLKNKNVKNIFVVWQLIDSDGPSAYGNIAITEN